MISRVNSPFIGSRKQGKVDALLDTIGDRFAFEKCERVCEQHVWGESLQTFNFGGQPIWR